MNRTSELVTGSHSLRKSSTWCGQLTELNSCLILADVERRADVAAQLATRTAVSNTLPVLPGLRELLPGGGLARGSVVTVPDVDLLLLALAAGASAAGAWCWLAGMPEAGVQAAADLGLCPERTLLTPQLDRHWPVVMSSLVDGCEIVIVRPPTAPSAQLRRRVDATLRRAGGVLLVAGEWPGAQLRLRVVRREWSGLGFGHGRLRACRAEVSVSGRGAAGRELTRWLWLPAEDGGVAAAEPPATAGPGLPGRELTAHAGLRTVAAG
jgi:hypothetical protein